MRLLENGGLIPVGARERRPWIRVGGRVGGLSRTAPVPVNDPELQPVIDEIKCLLASAKMKEAELQPDLERREMKLLTFVLPNFKTALRQRLDDFVPNRK